MELLPSALAPLSDRDVIAAVGRLARNERTATADLVAALAELDARRLYLGEGFPSLFAYCTDHLHFSKHEAYHRIEAARAGRDFPVIVDWLRDASLSLTAVSLLRPHLTADNHRALLEAARHQPTRAVEELIARVSPGPDTKTLVRRLPGPRAVGDLAGARDGTSMSVGPSLDLAAASESQPAPAPKASDAAAAPAPASSDAPLVNRATGGAPVSTVPSSWDAVERRAATPPRPAVVRPIAPVRYHVQMTISAETHAKLRRAQDLLRHSVPTADPALVVDRALTVLLQHLERTRCAATRREAKAGKKLDPKPAAVIYAEALGAERQENAAAAVGSHDPSERHDVGAEDRGGVAGTRGGRAVTAVHGSRTPQRNPSSRYVPAAVKRAVWARDQGQCAYVGAAGRCAERGFLELHHKDPFARGGRATAENLELRCRAHNRHEAERAFGSRFMAERIAGARGGPHVEPLAPTRCAPSLYECERSP